jgi:hypothetical protein
MAELLFPLAAVFVTVFLVVPALTLVSCAWLARRRARSASWADFGSNGTFALLVAPTMVPAIWLLSSAIHQVEPSQTLPSCWVDHMTTETCVDALILLSIVVFGGIVVTTSRAWRERPTATTRLPHTHGLVKRVRRIADSCRPPFGCTSVRDGLAARVGCFGRLFRARCGRRDDSRGVAA